MPEPLKHLVAWLLQRWPYTVTGVVVIAFLISRLYPVVKAWLDLKKAALDAKKADLEIKKLEREAKREESSVRLASLDEIKAYDPKTRRLGRIDGMKVVIGPVFFILLILGALIYLLTEFFPLHK